MTTYYVGPGGNDGSAGTSWATRKLTLNGVEDIPVVAGDTVYVGPGTYRELLTVDVSGSSGSPITYVGDYKGANTDGTGGVVRITGSDNDQSATRATAITSTSKNYRTFRGFQIDTTTSTQIALTTSSNWIIEDIYFQASNSNARAVVCLGAHSTITIRRCVAMSANSANHIMVFSHSSGVDDTGDVVENCVFFGNAPSGQVVSERVGGITVRNCMFAFNSGTAVSVRQALTIGQIMKVNNCILYGSLYGVSATTPAEFVEDYNTFFGIGTQRVNVSTGANSISYPPLFDARWFFEAVNGGSMLTPFDLASYSQLINVAGTSPTTTDLRGTSVIGAQREWGPLEYDPDLDIEAGSGGGGAVSISPFRGNIG